MLELVLNDCSAQARTEQSAALIIAVV